MYLSALFFHVAFLAFLVCVSAIPFNIRMENETASEPDCAVNSICYAMDQSGSISGDEYVVEQQFVIAVSRELNGRTNGTKYSAYGFSSSANLIQGSTTQLESVFIPAVNLTARVTGGTVIYDGLDACFREVNGSSGNRVIVIVTDGQDGGFLSALDLAPSVKAEGIAIVTVGVGDGVDEEYLRSLATTPNFFIGSSFDTLPSDVVRVAESSCDVVEVSPGPVFITPAPEPFVDPCEEAYDICEFGFVNMDDVPAFSVDGPPDVAFTPIVVSRNASERLGILNTNEMMVEIIEDDGSVTEITSLPAQQAFSPTQFKPFTIYNTSASGIGHESFQSDQKDVVRDRCVRVFFSQFQLLELSAPYNVVENVVVGRKGNKCVVFRTF